MSKGFRIVVAAAVACAAMAAPASAGIVSVDQITQTALPPGSGAALAPINIVQIGTVGSAMLAPADAGGESTLVEQSFASDHSEITQENAFAGAGLYAEVHQTAPGDFSRIVQSGAMNTAIVYQTTTGAFSSIVQSGFGNTALVRQ